MSDGTGRERHHRAVEIIASVRGTPELRADTAERQLANTTLMNLAYDFAFGDIWTRPGLTLRDRSMSVIAMLTALGGQGLQLRSHFRGGFNHGLSPVQLAEILIQAAAYAGFPRAQHAMTELQTVLQNLGVALETESWVTADDDERRAAGLKVMEGLFGPAAAAPGAAERMEERLGAVGRYALDFAFGEVWSRPHLTKRERSLVVVSILAILGREAELKIHVRGGLSHGLTPEELEEIVVTVIPYGGFPLAVEAMRTVREVLA